MALAFNGLPVPRLREPFATGRIPVTRPARTRHVIPKACGLERRFPDQGGSPLSGVKKMNIHLEHIKCWESGKGFSVYLERTPPIDLTELTASGRPAEIRIGPYKIEVGTSNHFNETTEMMEVGLVISGENVALDLQNSHGRFFWHCSTVTSYESEEAEAHGCFDIVW